METANVRHVSSFGLDARSPPFSDKQQHTNPREWCVSNKLWTGCRQICQTKWHWQVHCKSFCFSSQKQDVSIAQHGRISRGREYSHHAIQVVTPLTCDLAEMTKLNLTCPKLTPDERKEVQLLLNKSLQQGLNLSRS